MGSNYPRAMRTARDGGLWIGSFDGGLGLLRDGVWKTFDTNSGLPSNRIRGLLETSDVQGTALWIATDRGVARMKDGAIKVFDEATGLPSLDTEALCETVGANGETGLLVPCDDPVAMADAVERLCRDAELRERLGRNARDFVVRNFSDGHVVAATMSLYGRVWTTTRRASELSGTGGPPPCAE